MLKVHVKISVLIFYLFTIGCQNIQIIDLGGKTMGTTYSISIVNQSNNTVNVQLFKEQIDSVLLEISNIFSTYIENSEINGINNNQSLKPIKISTEMSAVLSEALKVFESTGGKFDVTMKPLIDMWGFEPEYNHSKIPSLKEVEKTKEIVGFEKIILKTNTLQKTNTLIQIDLNAIAKGWGVDRIAEFILDKGFENYLVEIGGEISVSGKNKHNKNWVIGIPFPETLKSELYTTITLSNWSVATSGTYANNFTWGNTEYSHIINPETGYPIKHDLVSATVVAKSCTFADAIATSVMVMGFTEGLYWINKLPDVECLLIRKNDSGHYIAMKSDGYNY